MHATCPRPGLSSVEAKTKAVSTYAQMVANKGRGLTSLKKPPTSSTKVTAAGGAPTAALKVTAATTPVATTEGPMGFVEALFGLNVLIHVRDCLPSRQKLTGSSNIAAPERDARDCPGMDNLKREQTSSPTPPPTMEVMRWRRSPETAREEGRPLPPPPACLVSYPDPYVRNDDHRLQYDITYRGSGNEVVKKSSWNVVGMYIVT